MKNKVNIKEILTLAGTYISVCIGSGFATGQEIMQFFSAHGMISILSNTICMGIMAYCGASLLEIGNQKNLKSSNDIFEYLNIYLNVGGEAVIFCQCLGDEKKVFFNEKVKDLCERNCEDVLCLIQDRIPLEYQLRTLTSLTKLFNADFDEENFEIKMSSIYENLNAKYLYSILYQIRQKQNESGELSLLQLQSKWDIDSHAKEDRLVNIVADNESYVINDSNKKRIGYLDKEAFDIYNLLKNGKSVSDITDSLYDEYKHKIKYKRFGKHRCTRGTNKIK